MGISKQAESLRTLPERGTEITVGLEVVNRLIRKLHEEDIVYCHWKSNEHLREGMLGITDLDILVERNACLSLARVLSETGFKRFAARPWRAYPAIEDYLSVDRTTGKLVHLHLHYQLTVGEKHLKGYRLPWEDMILSNRQFNHKEKIYVADSNVEMILLLVRAALKLRTRDRVFAWLGRPYFRGTMLKEFRWLKERTQMEIAVETAKGVLGKQAAGLVRSMITAQPSLRLLHAFRKSADRHLSLYRTYGKAEGILRRWLRELYWLLGAVNKRYLHAPVPFSRLAINGGLVVALVGPDGSGKSTLTKELYSWLSWKVDVLTIYFGSGDGPSSVIRWPLLQAFNLVKRNAWLRSRRGRVAKQQKHDSPQREPQKPAYSPRRAVAIRRLIKPMAEAEGAVSRRRLAGGLASECENGKSPYGRRFPAAFYGKLQSWVRRLKGLAKVPWALVLAYEKRRKLQRAWRARNSGMIVICDRYPQCQVMGFNDGPLLSPWLDRPSGLLRALAQWESTPYQWSQIYPPDLVIKFDVSPEIALRRKPDDSSMEKIRLRIDAIKNLRYPAATEVVTIDADELVDQVLLKVKRIIWKRI